MEKVWLCRLMRYSARVKELTLLKIVVPDEFVAGGIIAKFPPSWKDFTTALKHKRVHISISDLITSLDVEEKA
jgi:hypothetical protein